MRAIFLCMAWLSLAACHDSDHSPASPGVGTPPVSTTGTARVTISIPVPASASGAMLGPGMAVAQSAGARPTSYVSAKTRSVTVAVTAVDGTTLGTPVSASVDTVAGTQCSSAAGSLSCTVSIAAPVGNDSFTVSTFAQTGGVGQPISKGNATATVKPGVSVDVPVTLLGVVASVSVVFTPPGLPVGSSGTFTATIIGKDVNGDAITGTDNYYEPLTVSTADLGAHVTASPALPVTLSSPAQNLITLTYDGVGTASTYPLTIGGAQSVQVNYPFATTLEHLYVAYQFPAAVYVFDIQPDGSLTGPSRTIAGALTTLNRPTSIAVDDLGQLYVVNYGDFPNQGHDVAVFAAGADGNVAPSQAGLMVGQNPYYVSYKAGAFLTHPSTTDSSTATVVVNYGPGIPLVAVHGVSTSTQIPPYMEPNANGFASFSPGVGALGFLCTSQVSPYDNGNGYVSCITSPVEWVTGTIDPGTAQIVNGTARNAFSCCAGGETDVQFLSDGRLVVSQGPTFMRAAQVDTYVIPSDFSTAVYAQPVLSITGSETHLMSPTSMATDSHGNLYVGDTGNASGNGSVHVFAPGVTGNAAPIHELTGLNYPFGIAIGK